MSDESSLPAPAPVVSAALSAGEMLRQAREASGLHIAALAVSLKVPVKKLEALEADQLHALHDTVFVRALAASVCRTLRIEPAPVLALLPQGGAPTLRQEMGINTPFQPQGSALGLNLRQLVRRPVVMAVLVLLLAAAVVGFLPELQKGADWLGGLQRAGDPVAPRSVAPTSVTIAPAPSADAPTPDNSQQAPSQTPGVLENALPRSGSGEVLAPTSIEAAAVLAPANVIGLTTDASSMASAMLVFKARAPSWIEVADARGQVVLRRTLVAGESAATSGTPPLQAVVGRADAVDVVVRGKPFDLSVVSRDGVARFEVK